MTFIYLLGTSDDCMCEYDHIKEAVSVGHLDSTINRLGGG